MIDYPGDPIYHITIAVVDDDAEPSAANLALAVQGLADRTAYLKKGGAAVDKITVFGQVTNASATALGPIGAAATWQDFATGSGLTPATQLNDCEVGDVLEVRLEAGFCIEGVQTYADVRLAAVQDYGGANLVSAVQGAIARVVANTAETPIRPQPLALAGFFTVSTAGAVQVKLQGMNSTSGGTEKVGILGGSPAGQFYSLRIIRHRPI